MTKKNLAKGALQRSNGKDQGGEGRDLQSGTPQDSDLKTYSAPNREG